MARVNQALAVLAAALVLAGVPSVALASKGDVTATRAFVKANYKLGLAAKASVTPTERSIGVYIAQLGQQCPKAAFGSPGNSRAEQLSNEVVVILNLIVYHANAVAIANLAHTVKGLHWSNHKLTSNVDRYVARLQAFATMPLPDLCADVKAWAATNFKTVAADTEEVDHRYDVIEENPAHVSKTLITPYLSSADAHTFKLTEQLENHLLELENNKGAGYWASILETLAMNP